MAAGGGDHPAQLGQDRAAVREPGERVLAQQRLQPRALGDELLLEVLGPRGGLDARQDLAVGHGLDQIVLHAPAHPVDRRLRGASPGRSIMMIAVP